MSNTSEQPLDRLEKERARKRAKIFCRKNRRKDANRECNKRHRASESEAEHTQRLAADQQWVADRRASESEAQHTQHLAAD